MMKIEISINEMSQQLNQTDAKMRKEIIELNILLHQLNQQQHVEATR